MEITHSQEGKLTHQRKVDLFRMKIPKLWLVSSKYKMSSILRGWGWRGRWPAWLKGESVSLGGRSAVLPVYLGISSVGHYFFDEKDPLQNNFETLIV